MKKIKSIKLFAALTLIMLFFTACDEMKFSEKKVKNKIKVNSLEFNGKNKFSSYSIKIPQIAESKSEDIDYFNLIMQENLRYVLDNLSIEKDDGQIIEANIFYKEYPNDFDVLSIELWSTIFNGGAHPETVIETYNINKNDNMLLTFTKVFNDNDIHYFNNLINKRIEDNKPVYNTQGTEVQFFDDIEADIREAVFYFEGNNLVFKFQPYSLAPYSSGIPVFKFDKSIVKNHIHLDE